ncbi:cytochrome P450 [Corynascus similis CBS 632.67]
MAYAFEAIITVVVLILGKLAYTFIQNLVEARKLGLPVVIVPVDQVQLLWLLLAPLNRERIPRWLPDRLWRRVSLVIFGWEFHEKLRPFDEYLPGHRDGKGVGRSFILVGLRKTEIWTADPVAANDVLTRVREYEVPEAIGYALGTYGPNVHTSNGDRWTRHRKIITSVIDERILKSVFEESIRQTSMLLGEVLAPGKGGSEVRSAETPHLFDMLKKVTIHVLLCTSMGVEVSWDSSDRVVEPRYTMLHIESLNTMVVNIVGLGMLSKKILTGWPRWLPWHDKMTTIGCAKVEVEKRSREILDQERDRRARGEAPPKPTIVSKILRASEEGKDPSLALTEAERISNLFIVTAAGFETTATTLAYAMVLLVRYPKWQDWLLEERNQGDADTADDDRSDPCAGRRVYVNSLALHILPSWRDINRESDPPFARNSNTPTTSTEMDEYIFRPSRWINPLGSAQAHYHPPKGTWIPWAMGPRVCPGMKMAQVEFVAAMLTLLKRHRIERVPLEGEDAEGAEKRLDARLRDSRWVTVLQMNSVFEPREGQGLPLRIVRRR